MKSLARLQDKVKPFSYAEVEQIVTTELGARMSKAFSRFDPEPIAAASLGQVHSAALWDGRLVVVKVQRPNIRKQIAEDFEVLEQIAEFFDAHTELGRRHRFLKTCSAFQPRRLEGSGWQSVFLFKTRKAGRNEPASMESLDTYERKNKNRRWSENVPE